MTTNTPNTDPPMPGSEPFIHSNDSAPAYWWIDTLWIVLATATDTGGRHSLMEELAPKGSGPGPHKHTWSDETYYMLDGEMTFLIGEQIKTARKGDFVVVPRNTRHAFRVDSETARFLNGYTPASLEACVVERAMPATERVLPPENFAPNMSIFVTNPELLSRYGLEVLPGPDPLRPAGSQSARAVMMVAACVDTPSAAPEFLVSFGVGESRRELVSTLRAMAIQLPQQSGEKGRS